MAMILLFWQTRKRFYYFGVNEKAILLFGVGREYDFTIQVPPESSRAFFRTDKLVADIHSVITWLFLLK